MVDIIASSPSRSTAAKALVETAVRGWKMRYPTSKIDDCAVVVLFLDSNTNMSSSFSTKEKEQLVSSEQPTMAEKEDAANGLTTIDRSATVSNDDDDDEDDATEDDMLLEDYSALEGVTRVNTLLNLPRFTPGKIGQ